jgi:hypothetical protein
MKIPNLSPYLSYPDTESSLVSAIPNRGDMMDSIEEHLIRAIGVGEDGRLIEDAVYILGRYCDVLDLKWHLRLCRDTRNAHEVAGELAWSSIRLADKTLNTLDRLIYMCNPTSLNA